MGGIELFESPLPEQIGKYTVLERLATGGMAEVYLARLAGFHGFEKLVAIKRIRPELIGDPRATSFFLDEARLVATLEHPNIAQVYEMGLVGGSYYFVMEYLRGADLRQLLERARAHEREISLANAIYIIHSVCAGLHYAHEKRATDGHSLEIIHRDVSPSNVLLSRDGFVKVCDFGIAKATNRTAETVRGVLKGKFGYMSPEQCRSKPLDRRSDVFSIGILLYELTTMSRLFDAESDFELLRAIAEEPIVPPSQRVRDYPALLEPIVMRALSRDLAARYPTAQAMQLDLEDFAREHRLSLSAIHLASLMTDLFDHEPVGRDLGTRDPDDHDPGDPGDHDPGDHDPRDTDLTLRLSVLTMPGGRASESMPVIVAAGTSDSSLRTSGLDGPPLVRTLEGLPAARLPATPPARAPEGTQSVRSPSASFAPEGTPSVRSPESASFAPEGTPSVRSPSASFAPELRPSRRLVAPTGPPALPALLRPATIDTRPGFEIPLETSPEATPFDVDTQVSAEPAMVPALDAGRRVRRRRNALLAGALLAVLLAGAVSFAGELTTPGADPTTTTILEGEAERLKILLESSARAGRIRAAGIASIPILRSVVETDAATVRDVLANEHPLQLARNEELELFQFRDGVTTSLARIPERKPTSREPRDGQARLELRGDKIVIVTSAAVTTPDNRASGAVDLGVTVDVTVDRGRLAEATVRASIVGLGGEIALVSSTADGGTPIRLPIAAAGLLGAESLTLVATPRTAAAALGWVPLVRYVSCGVAGLLLLLYAGYSRRRSAFTRVAGESAP